MVTKMQKPVEIVGVFENIKQHENRKKVHCMKQGLSVLFGITNISKNDRQSVVVA